MPRLTREEADVLIAKGSRQSGDAVRTCARRQGRGGGATPKERDIQRAILAFLATVPGVEAFPYKPGMFRLTHKGKERMVRTGRRGVSDIVGWHRYWATCQGGLAMPSCEGVARFLAIEVKTAKTYPTAEQQAFLDQVKAAGGIAIVARSVYDVALALDVAAPASGAGARPR